MSNLEELFKAIEYLQQYKDKGIYFTFKEKVIYPLPEDIKRELHLSPDSYIPVYEDNKNIDKDLTARFCKQRHLDRKNLDSLDHFLKKEIAFLESISNDTFKELDYQLSPILKYFHEWEQNQNDATSKIQQLNPIWKENPRVSIKKMLEKGYDLGIWDEQYKIISQKGGLYGKDKTLLSALYIALKGNSIKGSLDYKVVGETLCTFFNVEIGNSKEPYKLFQSSNPDKIREFKRSFNLS